MPLSSIDGGGGGGAEASSFVRRDADVDVDVDADDDVDIDGDDEGGTGAAAAGAGGGGADEGSGRRRRVAATTRGRRRGRSLRKLADDIAGRRGRAPLRWTEILAMHASAAFAYSHHNVGLADVQVAIMTVIPLAGCVAPHLAASPSHQRRIVIASSMGAFVGGQSVIGSSRGGDDHDHDDGDYHAVRAGNYPWLLLLSATTGCVWRFVIDGPNVALLSGYAGRMGFATFVGMNAVMVTAYGPAGVVDWDRYYGGFVAVEPDDAGGIRHVGEAEDAPSSHTPPSSSHSSSSTSSRWRASWDWAEDEEAGYQAASYVLGAVWLGVVAGGTRVLHERRRLSRIDGDGDAASSSSPSSSHPPPPKPPPLDNVVVPAVFALSSMLAAYCVPRYESRAIGAVQRPRGRIVHRHGIAAEDTDGIEIRVGIAPRVGLGVGVDTVLRRVRRE